MGPRRPWPGQAIATTSEPQHDRTGNLTHRPLPRQPMKGPHWEGREQTPTTRAKKREAGTPPTATPTQPPTAGRTAPRERHGRTTTKVKEGPLHHTGQCAGTREGPPALLKTATHPRREKASRQAGLRRNPARTTHRTARARKEGYEGNPYRHAPPANPAKKGEATPQPTPRHKPHPPAKKGEKEATPLPSYPPPFPQHAPKHTRTKRQPEQERSKCNAHPPAHAASPGQGQKKPGGNPKPNTYQTQNPSQEKRGEDEPQNQACAPHNSKKPSVYSPDTEAAHAMQVTRRNEIRSLEVRLHPKASAALGLEAERAASKHLGTQVPRPCCWHAFGTGYARKSGEPLVFRPKEGTCASTGAHPPGVTSVSRRQRLALPLLPGAAMLGATSQV